MPDVSLNGIEFKIKGSTADASSSVNKLQKALDKLQNIAFDLIAQGIDFTSDAINNLNAAIDKLDISKLKSAARALEKITGAGSGVSVNFDGFADAAKAMENMAQSAQKFQDVFPTKYSLLDPEKQWAADMTKQVEFEDKGLLANLRDTMDFSDIDAAKESISSIRDKLFGVKSAAKEASEETKKVAESVKKVSNSAKKANGPIANFVSSIKRIAFYRILRSIIKSISQAFQEGLKNAYQFSKATGDEGGLAEALDRLATSSLTMKNQLGAAFGGLLTAITPIAIQIIGVVTRIAEAISRLLAILGGQGKYLKAKEFWTEWGDAAEGAGGAAKKALEYLAPFDELNVLPDPKSGGGGGGDNTNWGDMFEYAETGGESFLEGLTNLFQDISDWFQSKDWQDIGRKAWDTLKEIFTDGTAAHEAVSAFMEALGSAFGAITGAAWGFITGVVDDLIAQFKQNLKDYDGDGKLSATDFLKAIFKTGANVTKWVYNTLVKPFIDGFAKALTGQKDFNFTKWATENFLNPLIRAWNTFTQNMINPIITKINEVIKYINKKFETEIPEIPLIGEVEEIEITVPKEKRIIPKGKMTVKEFDDVIPDKKKVTKGYEAEVKTTKDKIPPKEKLIDGFKSKFVGFDDMIPKTQKDIPGFKANVSRFSAKGLSQNDRVLGSYKAVIKYQDDGMKKTQKVLDETARLTSVDSSNLTLDQKTLRSSAMFDHVKLSPAVKDPYYQDTIGLNATANITKVRGQTTIDMYTRNAANGAASANGIVQAVFSPLYAGGIPSSAASSESDGNMTENLLYRAFSRALADSDLGGDIELDGNTLYKAMVNRNRANTRLTGVNAMA